MGKKGAVQIKPYTSRSCLILVPHLQTRDKILDVGFWSAGNVAFSVRMWSPVSPLSDQPAPVWLSLHNIPPPLWSIDGFELIASEVGNPLPSSFASAPPVGVGAPQIRVVVRLDRGHLPSNVLVEDDQGFQVPVEIRYLNLPPICPICTAYGHRSHQCPKRNSPSPSAQVTDLPAGVASAPPSTLPAESSLPSPLIAENRSARSAALPPPSPPAQSVRSVVIQRKETTLMDSKSWPEGHAPSTQHQSNLVSKSHERGPQVTSMPTSTIQPISLSPSASSKSKPNHKSSQVEFASNGLFPTCQLPKPNLLLQSDSFQPFLFASPSHSTSTTRPNVPLVDP